MPKLGRLELNADGGLILNQSYVNTYLIHASVNYYWSEIWGFALEGAFGINQDKSERYCIENFYNNPSQIAWASCPQEGEAIAPPQNGNIGPAYVPIREINTLIFGNAVWSPVYGKQLVLLRGVLHFDLYFVMGGGVALSTFYDEMTQLRADGDGKGRPSRTPESGKEGGISAQEKGIGCESNHARCFGEDGRPDPLSQTHPVIDFGIGQKIHFSKNFNFKFELRNMTLLATQSGFENLFALWGGLAVRF